MQTQVSIRMQKTREAAAANAVKKRKAIKVAFNRIYEATPKGRHIQIDLDSIYQDLANSFFVSKATVVKALKTA